MNPVSQCQNRYLYPIEKEYLPILKDWRNAQMNVLRQTKLLTDEDQEKWFERIIHDKHQVVFVMFEQSGSANKKIIGYCGLTNMDFNNKRGEISFLVDPKRAKDRKVYRKDFLSSLFMLCAHGFDKLHMHKIYTETYSFRDYHIQILEEFGFKKGGVLRDHRLINDKFYDSLVHSVLETEWPQLKKGVQRVLEK